MRRLRLRDDESGFTLIEMVLVVAMLGIACYPPVIS
jgi:prepilin-type N-terminal cleavage/methylation domain-containing protein